MLGLYVGHHLEALNTTVISNQRCFQRLVQNSRMLHVVGLLVHQVTYLRSLVACSTLFFDLLICFHATQNSHRPYKHNKLLRNLSLYWQLHRAHSSLDHDGCCSSSCTAVGVGLFGPACPACPVSFYTRSLGMKGRC